MSTGVLKHPADGAMGPALDEGRGRFRSAARRAMETILAMVLVLVFFSVFLGLLNTVFPSGPGLKDLMQGRGLMTAALQEGPGSQQASPGTVELAAYLTGMRNQVKSKRATEIAWGSATAGMPLYNRDAVQTLSRSNATITFDDQNYLDMGQNSLVIIKRLEEDPALQQKRSFLVMVEGEMRGKLAETKDKSVQVEVATPSAVTRIQSASAAEGEAQFSISVNPDKSSTIAVYQGFVEVMAQGQVVRVGANQATVVQMDEVPAAPQTLPDAPVLDAPGDASVYYFRDLPPRIRFNWSAPSDVKAYHFVLARDPEFREIVDEDRTEQARFIHGNLRDGTYYWRVSSLNGSREGAFSQTWGVRVVQDREPPRLEVNFPPETIEQDRYRLKGKTEPGARVFVGGKRIPTNLAGEFEYNLRLRHGINLVVVESVDRVGNVSYRSRMVNRKF